MSEKLIQSTRYEFDIEYTKQAKKFLKNHLDIKEKIDEVILDLPGSNRVEKLSGYINRYKARVGKYRIIFEIYEDILIIVVVAIDSRGQVYKHLD